MAEVFAVTSHYVAKGRVGSGDVLMEVWTRTSDTSVQEGVSIN